MKKIQILLAMLLAFNFLSAQMTKPMPSGTVEYVRMTYKEFTEIDNRLPVFVKTIYSSSEMVFDEYHPATFFKKAKCIQYFQDNFAIPFDSNYVISVEKITYKFSKKELK